MQKLYLPRLCKRMWEGQNTRAQISARTPGRLRAPPEKPRTLQGRRASSQLACRFRMCIRICTERCLPYGTARTGRALAVNEVTVPCARTRCGRRAKNEDFVAARKRAIKRNASIVTASVARNKSPDGRTRCSPSHQLAVATEHKISPQTRSQAFATCLCKVHAKGWRRTVERRRITWQIYNPHCRQRLSAIKGVTIFMRTKKVETAR